MNPCEVRMYSKMFGAVALFALGACRGGDVEHIVVDGIDREYVIHVPPGVSEADTRPALVFMLHGTSGDGQKFYNISHWVETADRLTEQWEACTDEGGSCGRDTSEAKGGVITVFPSALAYCIGDDNDLDGTPERWVVTTKWASGSLGGEYVPLCADPQLKQLGARTRQRIPTLQRSNGQLIQTPADDVKFIDAILERVGSQYDVDPERIFVSGFSSGAQFAARLSLERSDTFAAAGFASGFPDTPGISSEPVPAFSTVGTRDPMFLALPDAEGRRPDRIPFDETAIRVVPSLAILVANATTLASLDPDEFTTQTETIEGQRVLRFVWDTPTNGVPNRFELLLLDGVEHTFPNGVSNPMVLSDELWSYFARYGGEGR